MLFSDLYKIMVNKITFVGYRGAIAPIVHPWIRPCQGRTNCLKLAKNFRTEESFLLMGFSTQVFLSFFFPFTLAVNIL